MSQQLQGRTAIVTGAASGIGAAIADLFARHGAKLMLVDLNPDMLETVAQQCRAHGVQVLTAKTDVSVATDIADAVNRCEQEFGGVDILVNNAGFLTQALCVDLTEAMWDRMMDVDLKSVFLFSKAVLPGMIGRRWGRIINTASQLGIKGGVELSHYSAAKAGVIGFTKSLALEVAQYNVLVNALAPGPIETPLVDGVSAEWKAMKAKELPLRRFGLVEEVAPTALLLASEPDGNLFVGQTLGPNSGDVMP